MPQLMRCPHCSKPLQVPDNAAGKQVRCPTCQKVLVVAPSRQPAAVGVRAGGPGPVTAGDGPGTLSSSKPSRPAAGAPASPPPQSLLCPACKAQLLPGAISCMDCGYLL